MERDPVSIWTDKPSSRSWMEEWTNRVRVPLVDGARLTSHGRVIGDTDSGNQKLLGTIPTDLMAALIREHADEVHNPAFWRRFFRKHPQFTVKGAR